MLKHQLRGLTVSQLKALIFDVDGTLTDNEQDGHRVAFNRAFEKAGLGWYWDEDSYDRLLEVFGGKERIRFFIEDFLDDFRPPQDLDAFIRELHAEKTRQYVALVESGELGLRPGVGRLLKEAHSADMELAIASTTTLKNATTLLRTTLGEESVGWFSVIACGDIVDNKKPAPDIYLHALRELGLPAENCLVIEDTEAGLASARAAGLKTVITVNRTTRGQDFSGAELVVDQLGEPGDPCEVLQGPKVDRGIVDLAVLRKLM